MHAVGPIWGVQVVQCVAPDRAADQPGIGAPDAFGGQLRLKPDYAFAPNNRGVAW